MHALERAGVLDAVRPLMIPMRGRMIHDEHGQTTLQRYGQNDNEVIHSVSRAELNKLLLTELERSASIQVQFRHNCQGLDFTSGRLRLLDESDGRVKEVAATPVIGADGASSAVRAAMHADGRTQASEEVLSHRYKELTIPAGPGGKHRMETNALAHLAARRLHADRAAQYRRQFHRHAVPAGGGAGEFRHAHEPRRRAEVLFTSLRGCSAADRRISARTSSPTPPGSW